MGIQIKRGFLTVALTVMFLFHDKTYFFSTLLYLISVWICRRLIYYLAEVDHSPFICVFNNGFYSMRLLQVFHGSGTQWRVRRSHQSTNLWANERPHAVIWGSGSSTTAALLLGERTHTGPPFTYVVRVRSLKTLSLGCKGSWKPPPFTQTPSRTRVNSHKQALQSEVGDWVAPKTTIKQRHKWHPPVTIPIVATCLCLIIYQMHLERALT